MESIEDYLKFLQHEQGATKTTYKSYHAYLRNYHQWLTENGYEEPTLNDFNDATVRRFFYWISSKGLRPRSIYGYMCPLRSFGSFLIAHKIRTDNPAMCVNLPKKDAGTRRESSEEEIALLLAAVGRQRNQNRAVFERAVLATLVYTGLRRAEVCDLKLSDLDLDSGWLLVTMGKGNKSRKVPLCTEVKDALAAWLTVRSRATKHDYLFSVALNRRMFYEGIRSVVENVKALAGLADRKHICPHSMRHACATRLMRQGATLADVMVWLGHSQIATTQRYLHCDEERLQKVAHMASLQPAQKPQEPSPTSRQGDVRQVRRMSR